MALAGYAEQVVRILNMQYGNVCTASVSGTSVKTMVVDWTPNTRRIHALKILSEIGSVKHRLYADGVRYFHYRNEAGSFNVVRW